MRTHAQAYETRDAAVRADEALLLLPSLEVSSSSSQLKVHWKIVLTHKFLSLVTSESEALNLRNVVTKRVAYRDDAGG